MPYVMLDDAWTDHPKLIGMCDDTAGQIEAEWLWVRLITYSNRFLTDGWIKVGALPAIGPMLDIKRKRQAVMALVRVGLLDDHELSDGGWQIHDYHDWQQSKAQVEDKRRKRRDAGRKGGLASAASRAQARADGAAPTPANGRANGQASATADAGPFATESKQMLDDPSSSGVQPPPIPSLPVVTNPSLSTLSRSSTGCGNAERDERIGAAVEMMARSDLEQHKASGARIANEPAYLAACRESRERDHAVALADLAAELPDAAPTLLVAETFRREFLA